MCYEAFSKLDGFTMRELFISLACGLGYLLLAGKLVEDDAFTQGTFVLSACLLAAYALLLYAWKKGKEKQPADSFPYQRAIAIAVLALVAVAAGCTFPGSAPSSAVPIQREFDGEVPEAVAVLTENAIADIAAGYNENGPEGGYVTEAKLTGLTPVPIEVSTGDAGVAVYRVEYRLHVRNGPAYLLAGGAQAEPSPTGGMWLTEWTSAGQPYYAFYWEEKDGETTLAVGLQNQQRFPGL